MLTHNSLLLKYWFFEPLSWRVEIDFHPNEEAEMFKKLTLTALLLFTVLLAWGSWVGAENTADETVRISTTDTTSGNLADKLDEGSGINIDNLVTGINEKLTISVQDKLSSKGDLLSQDGSGDSTLAVGSDGQVLVVDSTSSNGIKWGPAVDLSSPGNIGEITPGTGDFTVVTAEDYIYKSGNKKVKKIVFAIQFQKTPNGLQHKAMSVGDPISSPISPALWPSGVTGFSGAFANTPLINSTTDFVSGVGIDAAQKYTLFFDWTASQDVANLNFITPRIIFQNTTATHFVRPTVRLIDINGSNKHRLALVLHKVGNGALTNWDSIFSLYNQVHIFVEGWVQF